MIEIILAGIKARKNFYRNNFYRLVTTLFILEIIIAILIGLIIFIYFNERGITYYATANDGGLVRINSVSRGTGLIIPEDQRNLVEQEKS